MAGKVQEIRAANDRAVQEKVIFIFHFLFHFFISFLYFIFFISFFYLIFLFHLIIIKSQ
jgi:hypothetical protein